jgi:hypothetical protein
MAVKDPKELFVVMLSDLRRGTESSTKFFQELSGLAQDPDVKEAIDSACLYRYHRYFFPFLSAHGSF